MATSVHIPKPLLDAVDKRARLLKISRNRFIVRTLEREIDRQTAWSPAFFEHLTPLDEADAAAVGDMLDAIRSHRTRKRSPRL